MPQKFLQDVDERVSASMFVGLGEGFFTTMFDYLPG